MTFYRTLPYLFYIQTKGEASSFPNIISNYWKHEITSFFPLLGAVLALLEHYPWQTIKSGPIRISRTNKKSILSLVLLEMLRTKHFLSRYKNKPKCHAKKRICGRSPYLQIVQDPEGGHVVGGHIQHLLQNLLRVCELRGQQGFLHPATKRFIKGIVWRDEYFF